MKKTNKHLKLLKAKAVQLYGRAMLPSALVQYINELSENSNEEYICLLKELSEHYMRAGGYYDKYPTIKKSTNEDIKKIVREYNENGKEET